MASHTHTQTHPKNTRILIGSNLGFNFSPAAEVLYTDFLILLRLKGKWQIISILAAWKGQSATGKGARKASEFQNDGSVSPHRDSSSANHPTTHLKSCYFPGSLDWLQGSSSDLHPDTLFWHSFWHITYHVDIYIYIYGIYILTFYLACTLKFFLAFFWHSIWHLFWHSFWHHLASILVLSLASILFWHSAFYLAVFLAFYLTYLLTFCLEFYLAFSLAWVRVQAQSWAGDLEFGSRHAARSTASWAGDLVFRRRRWRRKKRRRRSCTFLKI